MCGRFAQIEPIPVLQLEFDFDEIDAELAPSFNIAPGSEILAIVERQGQRVLTSLRWGLVPSWAKDQKIGYKLINARAETLTEKPSFRAALQSRRCLVIASGFYEWQKKGDTKQPFYITLKDRKVFAFAGLHETWTGPEAIIHSCTIITTEANSLLKDIHSRMPVILPKEQETAWLDGGAGTEFLQLLRPYESSLMQYYPVSPLVNNPRNETIDCLMPKTDQ